MWLVIESVGFLVPYALAVAMPSWRWLLTLRAQPHPYAFSTCRAITIFMTSLAPSVMR